jgi:hypothetical protein
VAVHDRDHPGSKLAGHLKHLLAACDPSTPTSGPRLKNIHSPWRTAPWSSVIRILTAIQLPLSDFSPRP